MKKNPIPFVLRTISAVLVPLNLLSLPTVQVWAATQSLNTAEESAPASLKGAEIPASPVEPQRPDVPEIDLASLAGIKEAPPVKFAAEPSDEEISRSNLFMESLLPIGGKTSAAENRALAGCLLDFTKNPVAENLSQLEAFLKANPRSAWSVSLRTNLGIIYRRAGYWTKALDCWRSAWENGKDAKGVEEHLIVDRALSQLGELLSRLGRVDELDALINSAKDRDVRGSSTERFIGAKESLHLMRVEPDKSYRCGPFAVGNVLSVVAPESDHRQQIRDSRCSVNGTSLSELVEFAAKLGLKLRPARRAAGSAVISPSVVHWKQGHFAAIVAANGTGWRIEDPTFTDPITVATEALDQEGSGAFLIPEGPLPAGWTRMNDSEAKTIWGKGNVPPSTEPPPPCEGERLHDCPPCKGMATYNVDPVRVSLTLQDIPLSYDLPRGGTMNVAVNYSQREVSLAGLNNYSNFGPKWNTNLVCFIVDDGTTTNISSYGPGGGILRYAGYNATTGEFQPQQLNQAILKKIGTTSYERYFPDGSREVFGLSNNTTPKLFFLTESYDPAGNKKTYNYDSLFRLTSVIDPMGQPILISYTSPTSYLIESVSSLGRTAWFTYNGTGQLWKITDPVGIVSEFQYGTGDFVNGLTTPYGTTTFTPNDVGNNRMLDITDPNGETERIEFRYSDAYPDVANGTTIPTGMLTTSSWWEYRNTYHWDKRAFAEAPGNIQRAHLMHWLHKDSLGTIDILESEKWPGSNRVFYNYAGQTQAAFASSSNRVTKIGRVLDDGKSQIFEFAYNAKGKITKQVTPADPTATPPVPVRTTTYQYDAATGLDLMAVYQQRAGGQSVDPFGQAADLLMSATYNTKHEPLTVSDACGQTTTMTYNSYGQVKTITNAKSETTTFAYDRDQDSNGELDGYLQSITGPVAGATQSFQYDGFGRLWKTTDSENYTATFSYDAIGGVNSATLNRIVKITFPNNTTNEIYHRFLDVEWIKDRQNRWTHNIHDAARRLVAVQDPLGRVTQFQWCGCGSLEGIIDAAGQATTWIRDEGNRVVNKYYDDGSSISYTYEPRSGRLSTIADPRGQITQYIYNIDNTVKQVSYPNATIVTPAVEYTYDSSYQRVATTTVGGTDVTTYTYKPITVPSSLGAGSLETVDGPLADDTITYTWDALGRRDVRRIGPVGAFSDQIFYDSLGRISIINNGIGSTNAGATYHYVNNTEQLDYIDFSNQQRVDLDYFPNVPGLGGTGNGDRRLKQIRNLGVGAGGTGAMISQFDYEYNTDGQITGWSQQNSGSAQGRKYTLGYDSTDQLNWATLKNLNTGAVLSQLGYGYDAAGNRTIEQIDQSPKSASYDGLNRLTGIGGASQMIVQGFTNEAASVTVDGKLAQQYGANQFAATVNVTAGTNKTVAVEAKDASGNSTGTRTTTIPVPLASATSFTYDANGNTQSTAGGSVGNRSFTWDAANRLVQIDYPGTGKVTKISYDGHNRWTRILDIDGGVTTGDRRFVWDGVTLVEERNASNNVVKRFLDYGEWRATGGIFFYLCDHLGSVREVVDASGSVAERYEYDLWGQRTQTFGTAQPLSCGYTGHFHHAQSNLILAPYRQYDPSFGRWLSRDPIGEEGGLNLYSYAGGDPINAIDPLGLTEITVGGVTWTTPIEGDRNHTHAIQGVNQGPHLHGSNGSKFFPQTGMMLTKNGKWFRAPGSFLKEWGKKLTPKLARKIGIASIILAILQNPSQAGARDAFIDAAKGALWIDEIRWIRDHLKGDIPGNPDDDDDGIPDLNDPDHPKYWEDVEFECRTTGRRTK